MRAPRSALAGAVIALLAGTWSAGTRAEDRALPVPTERPSQPWVAERAIDVAPDPQLLATCRGLSGDTRALQACLDRVQRDVARRTAAGRLTLIGTGLREYMLRGGDSEHVLAASRDGRPTAWCSAIVADLAMQRGLDVVDDAGAALPRWNGSGPMGTRIATPLLDPGFRIFRWRGLVLPDGYVTLRHRSSADPLVVRFSPSCVPSTDGGRPNCVPAHARVLVHHDDGKNCSMSYVGRSYRENWDASMTPISLDLR